MDNIDERVLFSRSDSTEQFLPDNRLSWDYPANTCLPTYSEQSHDLFAQPHLPPMPPATAEQFTVSTDHLLCGGLITPTVTGTADFGMASGPGPFQPQWSGMSSSLPHESPISVPQPQNQYQLPYGLLCGWSRDFEPPPAPGIPNTPQSLPPALTHSHVNAAQYDAWMWHVLDGSMDTSPSSPDGDTGLSASGFLGAFAEYDFPIDAFADPQSSIALTPDAVPSTQSAAYLRSEPTCGRDRQARISECQWITHGVLCGVPVMADRRSVIAHMQYFHEIKPGEEKARQHCLWEQCTTTLNKESLARHILTVHLKEKVHCAKCGLLFARDDSLKRHLKGGQHNVPPEKSVGRQPSRNHSGFR